MAHPDLQAYTDGFFEAFLADLPGAPTRASLGDGIAVLPGEYIEYDGGALSPMPGATITPRFAVRTEADTPRTFVMLWIVERFDVATDSPETIARILADFRAPSASGGSDDTSVSSDLASTWSQALAADSVRQALARPLGEITEVPAGLPTSDLEELRTFLGHFGTYRPDGSYYAKGPAVTDAFPAGVTVEYLAAEAGNVAEVTLAREAFYCYALASERLWSPSAAPHRCRQLVYRIDDLGTETTPRWRLALLHTAAATQPHGQSGSQFIVFHAPVGTGLEVPESARTVLSASVAGFVDELPAHLADLATALEDPDAPIVGRAESPYVLLLGAVTPEFPQTPLPEGVIEAGEGAVRTFRCPPAHVMALATRPDVEHLVLSTPVWPSMVDAMGEINLAGRTFPAGIDAATTGRGVVVGIVDSGIDGGHPAFLGRQDDATKSRIHAVWHMWESGGESPWKRSGEKAEYRSMNFGREYLGHGEVTTTSDFSQTGPGTFGHGHGTHVAGIAAGRATGGWPGGIAPAATIVVASTSGRSYVNDVATGVRYCFNKATELGLPCVVNISLGTERHSHDGTDPLSVALTQLVSENVVPAAGLGTLPSAMPRFKPGRIIVAAAGNLRRFDLHWQATIPAHGEVSVLYQPFVRGGGTNRAAHDGITLWAYNEDATTVRLRVSARHSSNAVLATPEVALRVNNGPVPTLLPGSLRVNIHNGQQAPNNRHYNPEIYWLRPVPAAAVGSAPWIVRLRNDANSACVVHGFAAFREHRGGFVFDAAQTTPLIGVTYTADELARFNSHKVSTPATAMGVLCVAAFTSRPGLAGNPPDEIAPFSSPGPLRAAAPGQRAIDVAMPGHIISSAASWTPANTARGVTDKSGTSMASPVMTGLVAALLQQNPQLTTGNITTRLEIAATRRATDQVDDWGLGRVDAALFRA